MNMNEGLGFWAGIWGLVCVASPIWGMFLIIALMLFAKQVNDLEKMKSEHEKHTKEVTEKIKKGLTKNENN